MAQWRAQFGLDKPLHVQYLVWLKNLATLNFGESFKDSQSVWGKIAETVAGNDQIEPVVDFRGLFGRDSVGNLFSHPSQLLRRPGHDVGRFHSCLPSPWFGPRRWRWYLFAAAISIIFFRRAG